MIAFVAVVYFAIVVAIGAWATRRTRTAKDFFVAGQSIGPLPLAIAAMASTLSGFAFIGGPGLIYSIGMGAIFIVLSAGITSTMVAWALARKMRMLGETRGAFTVPDAIGARYRSRAAQGLSGLAMIIAIIGYMATNILALGVVIDAIFGIGLTPGIWIGMLITLAYSVTGGILAGVYTDVFQGLLKAVASVLVFVYAMKVGHGMSGISHTIMLKDAAFLAPWGKVSPMAALTFFFVFGVGALGQPHVIHKFYMMKDLRSLKWYPLITTGTMVVTLLLFFSVGVAVKALSVRGLLQLATPDMATPMFLLHFTPVLLSGVVFSGVAAAIMGTVNSFMNVGAAVLTHDFPVAFGKPVRNELLVGRISTIVISVAAALTAQLSGTLVVFLGIFGWGMFASTLVPSLAIGLNWEGATKEGAIASITTGMVFTLVFETLGYFKVYKFPAGVSVSGASLILSFLVFFVVSYLTRSRAAGQLDGDIRAIMNA